MNATLHSAFVFVLALGTSSAATQAADTANAQKAPVRSILDTHMVTGFPTTEVVQRQVAIPPGGVVGWHVHQGDGPAYVLSGESVLKVQGQPDRLVHAGDQFFMRRRGSQ
jgi:quercetin dioxygenase-like cupin family protein